MNPGIYIEEVANGNRPIEGVQTSVTGFLGEAEKGTEKPTMVTSWQEYCRAFGGFFGTNNYLPYSVNGFFDNGGQACYVARVVNGNYQKAVDALGLINEISILYTPNANGIPGLAEKLMTQCETLKDRMVILDAPLTSDLHNLQPLTEHPSSYAAYYFPWLKVSNPVTKATVQVPPGGHVAGIYAKVDRERGVHKAPANVAVLGIVGLTYVLKKSDVDYLNPKSVNALRDYAGRGTLVWGARTLAPEPEWRYINVRRLLIYLEQSITKSTQWAIFEPNEQKLWARLKQTVTEFLTRVWRDGMLMGRKAEEAFFVKVDRTTMTQADIDAGRIIMLIGVAAVKPAEFIIFRVRVA